MAAVLHREGREGHAHAHTDEDEHKEKDESSLAQLMGQQCLARGDFASAIEHFEQALATVETEPLAKVALDLHLLLAEALWQSSGGRGTERALPHYEAAAALAQAAGDTQREGMVALGHGFALSQLGDAASARGRLAHAKSLAEADGNVGAVQFAERLLAQVGTPPATGEEAVLDAWRQFAESFAAGKPVVLFYRGPSEAPADEASRTAAARLRACGCSGVELVDVCARGPNVPEGFQSLADSPHVVLPQLFLSGKQLPGWEELSSEALREKFVAARVELTEPPPPEPCHGASAFAEGLQPWEVALVKIISKDGAGNWQAIAEQLASRGFDAALFSPAGGETAARALEVAWQRLAPDVREKLDSQPEMPCGHSCSTCPTRHDCQLHDAISGGVKDIEALAGS